MTDRQEYKCPDCKASYWLEIPHTLCSLCGHKLFPVRAAKELIDVLFDGILGKDKK